MSSTGIGIAKGAKYVQTFRVPARTCEAWNGGDYRIEAASTVLTFRARTEAQAFRIAESIAKKNGLACSGSARRLHGW